MNTPSSAAPVSPIYTLTGNPLAEHTLDFAHWQPGGTARAQSESFQAGGKGINVSRMLTRLESPTLALCFLGGAAGADCEAWLQARGLPYRRFATSTPTQTGFVVRAPQQPETTFFTPDRAPDADAVRACVDFLRSVRAPASLLALCGSFPGWNDLTTAPLRAELATWATQSKLVIDAHGAPLAWAVQQPAALIKVNASEFRAWAQHSPDRPLSEILRAMRTQVPVEAWIITDGPAAVWVSAQPAAELVQLIPPQIKEVSATGSGDVLLACVLHAHQRLGYDWVEATRFALPYAAANAAHPGVADFPLPLE